MDWQFHTHLLIAVKVYLKGWTGLTLRSPEYLYCNTNICLMFCSTWTNWANKLFTPITAQFDLSNHFILWLFFIDIILWNIATSIDAPAPVRAPVHYAWLSRGPALRRRRNSYHYATCDETVDQNIGARVKDVTLFGDWQVPHHSFHLFCRILKRKISNETINVGSSSGSARFTVASRIPLKQLRSMGGTYLYDQQRTS